jgi:hypothetical protein
MSISIGSPVFRSFLIVGSAGAGAFRLFEV